MTTFSDPNRQAIWDLLRGRCVVCLLQADHVHEIVPRSQDPQHWQDLENRVLLCAEHHRQVHQEGTAAWAERLRVRRRHLIEIFS